ncbi:MAG: hypothetical protein ACR2KZ_06040 [Segetibacter sp.]
MRTLLFIIVLAIAGCRNIESDSHSSADKKMSMNDSSASPVNSYETDFTEDSIITIKFPKDSSSTTVKGRIKGINNPITVNVPVTKGDKLMVRLIPEGSVANIRINQLFMPDGKADGPFGRRMDMKIRQHGDYKIIVGENLMQGEEWKGNFTLTVKVE